MDKEITLYDDKKVINNSGMIKKAGFIFSFLSKFFFQFVNFPLKWIKKINEINEKGICVFVINTHSLLDYLYFNYAFLCHNIPLCVFATGINTLIFQPIKEIFKYFFKRIFGKKSIRLTETELLRDCLEKNAPVVIFLRRPKTLIQWGEDYKIQYLKEILISQMKKEIPLFLVPQIIVWEKKPEQYKKNIIDIVFGDPQAPGRIRKLINFILNYRRAFVQLGEIINLKDFIENEKEVKDIDALAQKLKWRLHHEFYLEQKVIRGPVLKGSKKICEEIMKNKVFLNSIEFIAKKDGVESNLYIQKAKKYLKNLSADFNINYIEGLSLIFTTVWYRLYAGIEVDTEGLEKIREEGKKTPLIIVPSHKSHIDYLMISYIFYTNGLIPPHITAGDNLSFWPMGHIFRHCGAFFIKRKIGDNELYRLVLKEYVRKLLKEGYWIEFFIEGGRSRTGKLLPPKRGFLSMIVDAMLSGATYDVKFVPTSLTYEKVIEETAYTKEITGEEKKKRESFLDLVKTPKVLKSRYGKIYVEFEEILSLRKFLQENNINVDVPYEEKLPDEVMKKLQYSIVDRINNAGVVTPTSLTLFSILNHTKRGISRETLIRRVGFVINFIMEKKGRLSDLIIKSLEKNFLLKDEDSLVEGRKKTLLLYDNEKPQAEIIGNSVSSLIDETMRIFYKNKALDIHQIDEDVIITPIRHKRVLLDYYKNNIIHYFVSESLFSLGFLNIFNNKGKITTDELKEDVRFLSKLFKYEFIYRENYNFDENFNNVLKFFLEEGVIFKNEDGFEMKNEGGEEVLGYFANVISNFIESYLIVVDSVLSMSSNLFEEKEIIKLSKRLGERLFHRGEILLSESISMINFSNAILYLKEEEILKKEDIKSEKLKLCDENSLQNLKQKLSKYHKTIRGLRAI